jgi:uncharacterized protein YndB with AHSA1/START domain
VADEKRFPAGRGPQIQFPRPADAALERRDRLRSPRCRAESATVLSLERVGEEAANGLKTIVTWTLTPTRGGVLVRMEQSGFRPEQDANYQGANYGWQKFIGGLYRVAARLN